LGESAPVAGGGIGKGKGDKTNQNGKHRRWTESMWRKAKASESTSSDERGSSVKRNGMRFLLVGESCVVRACEREGEV